MTLPNDKPPTAYRLALRLYEMGALETHPGPGPTEAEPLSAEDAAYAINSYLSSEALCGFTTHNGKPCRKFREWFEAIYQQKWVVPAYLARERANV